MRRWSLFFLLSSAMLAVTCIAYGLPIMLGILCVLMFAGLILFDLSDTVGDGRACSVSNNGPVRNFVARKAIRERNREKKDKAESTIDGKSVEKIDPVKLQMEFEANRLLSFYIWYLLAGTKELTFGEMAEKVNQKFRGFVSEKDLAKMLVDDGRLRGGPFFNCAAEGLKNRIAYFLQCTLRKKLISLQCSFSRANTVLDSLYRLEKRQQQIRDIELKTLLNARLKYRANRDSPWWSVNQRKMDRGLHLARLNNLFPGKETSRIYE